jgi:membrane protein
MALIEAAALSYYTVLSLSPLLAVAIVVAGFAFGPEAARGHIARQLQSVFGLQASEAIQSIVANAQQPGAGYARECGSRIVPARGAVPLADQANASKGIALHRAEHH